MAKWFLPNSGFELGDRDWTKGSGWTIESDAVNSRSGSWVAKNIATSARLTQAIALPARPGGKISIEGWYKHTADRDATSDFAISFRDKDGTEISLSSDGSLAAGTTSYTQLTTQDAVCPARTKSVVLVARSGNATVGTLWADDLSMSGDIIEDLPVAAEIQSSRMIAADTVGVFDPLIGDDRFSEFNSGMSDKWAGVYEFVPRQAGGNLSSLLAFIRRLGRTERFFAFDPDHTTPINGVVNGMTVDGAVTGGATRIPVTGGPVSSTALVDGDYVEIGSQYFQLQRNLDIGPEGTGEMIVWPSVRSTLADGEDVITDNPKMVARITSDMDWVHPNDTYARLSISWQEV